MCPPDTVTLERCRVLVPMWSTAASEPLTARLQTLSELSDFYGGHPSVLGDVFVWTGWIPGGLATVAETLLGLTDEHPTTIFASDDDLDIAFESDADDVTLLGPRVIPKKCSRAKLRAILADSSNGEQLRGRLITEDFRSMPDPYAIGPAPIPAYEPSDETVGEDDDPAARSFGQRESRRIKVVPVGHIDFELLDEANFTLTVDWSPDPSMETCEIASNTFGGSLTLLWPPGLAALENFGLPGTGYATLSWYAAQWGRDDDPDGTPRAHGPIALAEALPYIEHPDLVAWMRRMTENTLEYLDELDLDDDTRDAVRIALIADIAAIDEDDAQDD